MENAQEQMEFSQCENKLQVDAQASQMEQLAKNVDHIQIAPGSVNNNSGNPNLEENVVHVEEFERGEELEERALINPDEYELPGCVKCMMDECGDPWCKWCTLGFCTKGQLCKNIYSHFAMCGNGTNFCRESRLRNPQNDRNVRRIQSSGNGGNGNNALLRRFHSSEL